MLRHLRLKPIAISLCVQLQRRSYQSKSGVYGFRPPVSKSGFKVPENVLRSRNSQSNVYRWVEAYRKHGHKLAAVNPINIKEPARINNILELNHEFYGLQLKETIQPEGLINVATANSNTTVENLQSMLQQIYCGCKVGAEFSYLENLEEREWLAQRFEQLIGQSVSNDVRRQIAELLIKSQAWDNFMATKFPTVKRYGGEGAESLLAFYWQLLQDSARDEIKHLVVAMPHRGRTNLQTVLLNLRPAKIFHKLRGESEFPDEAEAMGDILSHFHVSEQLELAGRKINVSMVRNPSHLEAANPVAMGKTRSKQQTYRDGAFSDDPSTPFASAVLNVMVHGDAAFAGQGINQEILNMAYVPHFEVGGTIHLIVNNQIGFTTPGDRGRSTEYASDLAKTIQAPVFHVNGDEADAVALITKLAFDYQRRFRKDVFIDLNCFRRWGHNELDDPKFTNPLVYQIIEQRRSVPDLYAESLAQADILSAEEARKLREDYMTYLNAELQLSPSFKPEPSYLQKQWANIQTAPDSITFWDTGLDFSLLSYIGHQSVAYPDTFTVHPHLLKTHILGRRRKLDAGDKIDWSTAEALAIGSLMYQGHSVRLSGEDVGRGTFSHRHVMLVDQVTNDMFIPLNELAGGRGGKLEVAHSILSEEAVLGFEYGVAIDNPNTLVIWEAQFGDFANGAQIIIDNFILSGETKWMESNALTILLPHGFDGAGSEHSSCRIERFLQMSDSKESAPDGDNVNVHIVNPTTSAQYFHVLRRQMLRNFRKPLVVVAPKILLRMSEATSTHTDFQPGSFYRNVLGDAYVNPHQVRKVILCSGKHYYKLHEQRQLQDIHDTAILRLESLSPFPLHELQEEISKFRKAKTFIWSQEEHRNMGAWRFVQPRFEYLFGKQLKYCGRAEGASSATGVGKIHKREAEEVVVSPFKI